MVLKANDIQAAQLNESQSILNIKLKNDEVYGLWIYDKTELQSVWDIILTIVPSDKATKLEATSQAAAR